MESYREVNDFLDYMKANMIGVPFMKGGSNTSAPYDKFENLMDKIFDYTKYVYQSNKRNKDRFNETVKNLDKDCNCKCSESNNDEYEEINEDNEQKHIYQPIDNEEPSDNEKNKLLLKGKELE